MTFEGIESCASSRRRKAGAEEARHHSQNAALAYWSVEKWQMEVWKLTIDNVPAGFGYSFFNERLNDYYGATGLNEFSGNAFDVFTQPLVNQPGSRWEYGINIDW